MGGLLPNWEEFRHFARVFLRHPLMLGSMFPSSRYLVDHLLEKVDFSKARVIVEYGPGVGTITRHLLEKMNADAVLVAIEMNDEFVQILRRRFPDARLRAVHGSASDVSDILKQMNLSEADYIISGIPFTTLPEPVRRKILSASREALGTDGIFLIYQYTRAMLPYLRRSFRHIVCEFEPRNILPAQLFVCEP